MHQKYVAVPYYSKITHMQKNTIYSGASLTLVSVWVQVYHAISSSFYVSSNHPSVESQLCVVALWHFLLSASYKHKKSTVCPSLSTLPKEQHKPTSSLCHILSLPSIIYSKESDILRSKPNASISLWRSMSLSFLYIYFVIECDKPS